MQSDSAFSVLAVSIPEAARRLGVSKAHLYRIIQSDKSFPKVKPVGTRSRRIKLTELEAWFDAKGEGEHATSR
jgi:excisionase family DNA binding protein